MPKPARREGLAATAAPSNALTVWCDRTRLMVEVSTPSGPRVLSYDLTSRGLSEALALIRGRPYDFPGTPMLKATSLSRSMAEGVCRNLGLIK